MDSPQSSGSALSHGMPPPGFMTIDSIRNLPNSRIAYGSRKTVELVNVIGFLRDFQPPRQTNGKDWKCSLEIADLSLSGPQGIKLHIFLPENKMPKLHSAGDAVLLRKVKPQLNLGLVSLLTTFSSEVHIIAASNIPKMLPEMLGTLWESHPPTKCTHPTSVETAYVIRMKGGTDSLPLPTNMEFEERSRQAMRANNKFSALKDVESGRFYDILGEVIKVHEGDRGDWGDRMTVYLSDYTANSKFYEYSWGDTRTSDGRDGDEHNYLKGRKMPSENAWPGPYGKLTIQLTLYDNQAVFVREEVYVGNWILLRNVQTKYGQNGNLEGILHGDKYCYDGKIQVEVLERPEDPSQTDPRWKEAVTRKFEYDKRIKQRKIEDKASELKRKREDEPIKSNSKERRKAKRAAAESKVAAANVKLGLNHHIWSASPDECSVRLADIMSGARILTPGESGRQIVAPFDVCKYKANIRVVDYFPSKIEDFAVGRRKSEYDMLSDYSGGEDTDPEENMRSYKNGKGFPEKTWEWRFALQVVDADAKTSNDRMWLVVGNYDAQTLLEMDATNLRKDGDLLLDLKERLCILWGDLEEQKSALDNARASKQKLASMDEPKLAERPTRKPGDQPSIDSDNEDEKDERQVKSAVTNVNGSALGERDLNIKVKAFSSLEPKQQAQLQIKNKAFTCCIKQYGVKIKESNPLLANAGNGKRWERRFGLFGTKIQ